MLPMNSHQAAITTFQEMYKDKKNDIDDLLSLFSPNVSIDRWSCQERK